MTMPEKRQHQRLPAALTVIFESRGDLQEHQVTDVSTGGLFVKTDCPLPIGTELALKVILPPNNLAVSVQGRVTWVREKNGAEGMGIKFTGVTGALLAEMVQQTGRRRGSESKRR
jgi:uncharacterized protein (TIGR02266 family)